MDLKVYEWHVDPSGLLSSSRPGNPAIWQASASCDTVNRESTYTAGMGLPDAAPVGLDCKFCL